MRRLLFVAAALSALSCSPKPFPANPTPANPALTPPPPPPPLPPGPPGRADAAIRLGPSALRYVMHQIIHIDQEFQGIRQPLDFGLRAFFAVTIIGPADTSGYPTTITIDSIVADSGTTAPMGINLGAAKALSFAGRLTPKGEFRNQKASDSTAAQSLAPVVGSFKNFFPRLPATGLTLGATWADTVTENDRAAGSVTVTSINRSHAVAWEDRMATRALRVDVLSDFTVKGTGKSDRTSTRSARVAIRSSHATAWDRLMLVTVTLPAARSFSVTVSAHVAPSVRPVAGSRGKKFLNEPTTGARDWDAVLSDAFWLRNSPFGVSRPANESAFAAPRLMPIGAVVPESATIESIVIVVGYPLVSAGPMIVTAKNARSPKSSGWRIPWNSWSMWMIWCITYRSALGPKRIAASARPGGPGGSGGGGGGGVSAGLAGVGLAGKGFGLQLSALSAAATNRRRRIRYSLVLVRPKMATTSVSSLMTLRSFHPRFRMSLRQLMSFSHSAAVVRKTRKSATFSQCGG